MAEYVSRNEAINAIKSLESSMPAKDNYAKGYDAALGRALIAVREVPPVANVQPLNVVAEHIKNRLYETALNTNGSESDTIAAMAERIDFWVSELKEGEQNGRHT